MSAIDKAMPDRPSRHGELLGEVLAALAEAGRDNIIGAHDLCATCAFRAGSVPNMCASTGKIALDIAVGLDSDDFACHHGMKEGRPTKGCVGAELAKAAPRPLLAKLMEDLAAALDGMSGDDEVRAEFDRWWSGIDSEHKLNVYELASAYARRDASRNDMSAGVAL